MKINKLSLIKAFSTIAAVSVMTGCSDNFLDQDPLSF